MKGLRTDWEDGYEGLRTGWEDGYEGHRTDWEDGYEGHRTDWEDGYEWGSDRTGKTALRQGKTEMKGTQNGLRRQR